MKFSKSLLWAFAGLGLFACSNEEVVPEGGNMEGNGVVEVKIVTPNSMSRTLVAATPGSDGDKVQVEGKMYIKLTAGEGGDTQTVDLDGKGTGTTTVKFWGVQNPTKIEAWINDGDQVNNNTAINASTPAMQAMPVDIPAYGSSETFTLTGRMETNEGKSYEMYTTSVEVKIPVARLEVSGIKHVTHPTNDGSEATCKYDELTIDGIYLDKILATKGATNVTDYKYPEVVGGEGVTAIPAPILWDEIDGDFLAAGAVWPATADPAQAYAFNFYPDAAHMPILKIYFAKATASDLDNPVSQPRYAVIKSYNGDEAFKFEAGKIYRITDVTLSDKNIIGDEEGNNEYGVDVTVTEAQWTIVDTTADWIAQ